MQRWLLMEPDVWSAQIGKAYEYCEGKELTSQKANCILGYVIKNMVSSLRKVILPLYSIPVRPHLGCWGPQCRKDIDLFEQVQRRAMNIIRGLEHLSYEDRLRDLDLFSLEKRRLCGDLFVAFQYLKGAYETAGEGFFTKAWSDRTRGNGFKLKESKLDGALNNPA
ncbi:hypothetical protein WISP_28213 [Willisornis vidua]|uniref:Uncharacterized protein n=1 Tax=Willisornis vidua TaxID=1566151 RepID=A0ABQ9DRS3_9PASS|nr:hypothetical protein WISP_28213 [Willisornis vidua]